MKEATPGPWMSVRLTPTKSDGECRKEGEISEKSGWRGVDSSDATGCGAGEAARPASGWMDDARPASGWMGALRESSGEKGEGERSSLWSCVWGGRCAWGGGGERERLREGSREESRALAGAPG